LKIFYLFIDGIGFGLRNESNPFYRYGRDIFKHLANEKSYLSRWAWKNHFDQKETNDKNSSPSNISDTADAGNTYFYTESTFTLKSIDPSSGISGLPQSGTGQTSLFTGVDAPLILNRHIPNFPSFTLKKFISKYSLIKKLVDEGKSSSLLNSYSPFYFAKIFPKKKFLSASTLVQLASDQPLFDFKKLAKNESLYMDITHQFLINNYGVQNLFDVGDWSGIDIQKLLEKREPAGQGKRFIQLGRNYDCSLFEFFLSDRAGHSQNPEIAVDVIDILEKFTSAAIDELNDDELLIVSSDHGNLENLDVKIHTHNAVPIICAGKNHKLFVQKIEKLAHIPRQILNTFQIDSSYLTSAHLEK
jgi:hypothetical protein